MSYFVLLFSAVSLSWFRALVWLGLGFAFLALLLAGVGHLLGWFDGNAATLSRIRLEAANLQAVVDALRQRGLNCTRSLTPSPLPSSAPTPSPSPSDVPDGVSLQLLSFGEDELSAGHSSPPV
jgi:hypothetical protein